MKSFVPSFSLPVFAGKQAFPDQFSKISAGSRHGRVREDMKTYQSRLLGALLMGAFLFSFSNRLQPAYLEQKEEVELRCEIKGAVMDPGIYTMSVDDCIEDLIQKAGGLSKDADTSRISLMQPLKPEDLIVVPAVFQSWDQAMLAAGVDPDTGERMADASGQYVMNQEELNTTETEKETRTPAVRISINAATSEELQQLPGIGPVIAQRIIDYRTAQSFLSLEEIMEVKGIGEKTFAKIREYICL